MDFIGLIASARRDQGHCRCIECCNQLLFRPMEMQDFIGLYGTKTDEELLRLSLRSEQLTMEASSALTSELARRGINSTERLATFRDEEARQKVEDDKNLGTLFLIHPYGIGRKRFGEAEYVFSSETGIERFKTTVFIVLFWFPLIPTGTYMVERNRKFLATNVLILEKLSLDWEQVVKVWVVAAVSILGLSWVVKILHGLLY
jgi:hypothetical protein